MEFFAVNGKRPVISTEKTRKFAYESLNHKYGLMTKETPCVNLDDVENFASLKLIDIYDIALERIAKEAPIRICEDEKISGAATFGDALIHVIPAKYNGNYLMTSLSHHTPDFHTVLTRGMSYLEEKCLSYYNENKGTEKERYYQSALSTINSMKIWHKRYLEALKDKPGYSENYKNLQNVPFKPAASFYEAVQSLWFCFAYMRLNGNWPGIGRIDWLLGDYLKKDLEEGKITLEEAREILAHFFIKGCEWITGEIGNGSGDAQYYQNILLGGIDENGNDITNEVTYLVLDIIEEFGISDFPTTVRIGKNTPEKLLKRVAEVIRYGGGVVAVYNEDLVIETLTDYGYPLCEARNFANDGCWEVQVPGKTYFSYLAMDSLSVLQNKVLNNYEGGVDYECFEELYNEFKKHWKSYTEERIDNFLNDYWNTEIPTTLLDIFEEGCIEKGKSYFNGGPKYLVNSPHIGGLPDVTNSLYAIKKLVFDDKLVTFTELMEILKNNWEGNEELRLRALNKYSYYGNDNDEVDEIAKRIIDDFADACDGKKGTRGFFTPAGVSTFGRQLEWSPSRLATPSGHHAHDILAGNFSPTPGTDREGATAIIKSYCKTNLKRTVTGAALDIKLLPSAVKGENGVEAIISLLKGFVLLGGFFMQLDIADTELLKAAQEDPEKYQNLSVRVSGWNARFATLNKEWQDMIIAQTGSEI